jgi:hypothetical protein
MLIENVAKGYVSIEVRICQFRARLKIPSILIFAIVVLLAEWYLSSLSRGLLQITGY